MIKDKTDTDVPSAEDEGFLEDAERTFRWRDIPIEGWVCIPIFWVLAFVVFWQFFTRYFLNDSAVWTEELARQLLVLLTFFGAGYALGNRAHICINYFVDKLSGKAKKIVGELSSLLQFAFYAYSCWLCLDIAEATQYQRLMSVDISKGLVYQAVAISLAAMALRSAIDVIRIMMNYRTALPRRNRGGVTPMNGKETEA